MAKKSITVKFKRSTIGCPQDQIDTVRGLGLRRLQEERTLENTPAVRGMIKKVIHLVEVVKEE
jgi:large subunit ribosomal protein L30